MKNCTLKLNSHLAKKFLDYAKCADCSYDDLKYKATGFFNRFKILAKQPDTVNGFSAILFMDTFNQNQKILAICGTKLCIKDISADMKLAMGEVPIQCYELAQFYESTIKKQVCNQQRITVFHHLSLY